MALSTTDLKLTEVTAEIAGTQDSLQDCVDTAFGTFNDTYYTSPADRLSDFRGYSDVIPGSFSMTNLGQSTNVAACANTSYATRFHDGSNTYPVDDDIIYTNPQKTTKLNGGNNWYKSSGNSRVMQVSTTGVVINESPCPTVPSAPTGLASAHIANTSFDLSWTAPNNGGSTITGYKIYKGGSYYTSTTGATSKTITGLTAGSTSTWTVKATNAVGDSSASSGKSVTQTNVSLESISMTQSGQGSAASACLESDTYTRYTDGNGLAPLNGDYIYTDSAGTTKFDGNANYFMYSVKSFRVSILGYVDLVANCGGCFIKGTKIIDKNGNDVNIETLKVGDELLTCDIENLGLTTSVHSINEVERKSSTIYKFVPKKVEHTIILNNGLLEATPCHNHLIQRDGEWKYVKFQEIEIGDKMYGINKEIIEVTSIDYNIEDRWIYKITLEDTHTYFANGILTHNLK